MERSAKDIDSWVKTIENSQISHAKRLSRKRMGKDYEGCSKQVKLKIMASVNRIIYG